LTASNKKILIVDDDRNFNLMLSTQLKKKHFNVVQAYSAEEGILKSKEQSPDLVVTDVRLPDKDGFEFVHKLTADNIKTRIILLSGLDFAPDKIKKAESEGACECIVKSEKVGDILRKIETAIASENTFNL